MTLSETVAVTGNVNLILPDNTTLTAPYGINIPANASLTVWGQSGRSGKLTVLARTDSQSGIGGASVITINGGIVEATSETGGGSIACGGVTINGGQVTAQGNPGIVAQQGTASLSWTHSDDSITASSYSGTVTLRKTFVDAFGTLYQAGAVSTIGTLYGKTLRPAPHNYIKVEKVEPTYDPQTGVYSNGNIEYYTCSDCDSCFTYDSAANAYTEIAASAVVVPYFAINDNGTYVRIMKYNGTDSVITVPDTVPDSCPEESLRGKPITSINQSAFKENTTITRVTMGDNIVHIGWEAFRYASNLEAIAVGSGLRVLESSIFYNTPNLTKFTCTNTEHQIALTCYPFDASSDITFYGMHKGAFRTAYEHSTFKVSVASFQYIGIDEHTVTWSWNEDNSACTATICADCDLDETMDAEVTVLEKPGQAYNILSETVYTASVTYEGVLYTDEKTVVSAGSGTKADPYIISNAEVWNAVAANISNGIDADKCFKLSDDFSDTVTVKNGDSTVTISGLQNVYSTRKQAGDGGNNFVRNADSLLVKRTRPTGICQSVTAADGNTYYYNTVTLSGLKESYTTSNAASRHYALTDEAGYALVKDTDYTVSMEPEEMTGEGSYTLTFSGKGIYEGTISFTFTVESTVGDVLNRDFTGVGATTAYTDWSGKTGASGAVYAGNSVGDHGAIQIRSANSTSGIITTASGGLLSKVSVLWNDNTGAATSERSLLIYGKNTPYESPTDLYDEEKQGTLLGKIVYGEETAELEITGDYACIGLRSSNGALFLQEVTIRWAQTPEFTVAFDSDGGSAVESQIVADGGRAARPEDPTKDGFTFAGWTLNGEVYDFDTPVTADITLTAVWEPASTVTINGVSGSFNDRIKLNFYFGIPDAVLADEAAYVTLTNEATGKATTILVKDAELIEGKGRKFSILLAAKEASDKITAKVFDGEGNPLTILGKTSGTDYTETGVEYTLMQYFTWLEEKGTDADEKAVGTAAKDYCAATQIYFDYNADGVSVSDAVNAVTTDMLSEYAAGRSGTLSSGVSIRGITAMLESDNTIRLYLGFKDVDPDDFTYAIDGNSVELKARSDGTTYLALDEGVWSNRLQDAHTYSVSDSSNTYTISASVLTYARSEAIKSADRDTKLGKALYLYNRTAIAAFGE